MSEFAAWLPLCQSLYDLGAAPVSLAVLIFLRRGDTPSADLVEMNMQIFKIIFGNEFYRHLTFVTVTRMNDLEYRLGGDEITTGYQYEYRSVSATLVYPRVSRDCHGIWRDFVIGGARVAYLGQKTQSAYSLLNLMINESSTRIPTGVMWFQRELSSHKMSLSETIGGSHILLIIRGYKRRSEEQLERLKARHDEGPLRTFVTQQVQLWMKKEQDFLSYNVRCRPSPEGST